MTNVWLPYLQFILVIWKISLSTEYNPSLRDCCLLRFTLLAVMCKSIKMKTEMWTLISHPWFNGFPQVSHRHNHLIQKSSKCLSLIFTVRLTIIFFVSGFKFWKVKECQACSHAHLGFVFLKENKNPTNVGNGVSKNTWNGMHTNIQS